MNPTLLSQDFGDGDALAGFFLVLAIVQLAIAIVTIVGWWKSFEKAGQPGWAAIIPVYNLVVMFRVGGLSGWWAASILLAIIPILGALALLGIFIWANIRIAERFGHGVGFALGLTFLSPIFWCILGFGASQYRPAIPAPAQA
jgi:hypothetical protein